MTYHKVTFHITHLSLANRLAASNFSVFPFNVQLLSLHHYNFRRDWGCLPFVRINRLGRALNNGKSFSKISNPTERNGAKWRLPFALRFRLMRDWKLESLANFPPFRSVRKKRIHDFRTEFPEKFLTI